MRIADGATGSAPPRTSECPTRPVCQSCAKIVPQAACTAFVTVRHAATCSGVKSPGVSGLPSASREMLIPSLTMSPAVARCP